MLATLYNGLVFYCLKNADVFLDKRCKAPFGDINIATSKMCQKQETVPMTL